MKLLFDENLSPRLVELLGDLHPESGTFMICGWAELTIRPCGICAGPWIRDRIEGLGFCVTLYFGQQSSEGDLDAGWELYDVRGCGPAAIRV